MNNPLTAWAVRYFCKQIKADAGYWESWQANIAMAFIDEVYSQGIEEITLVDIPLLANRAANRFLLRLTKVID